VVIVNSTTGQTPAESPAPPDAGGVSVDGDSIVITSSSRSYPPQPTLHLANPTSGRLPILPLGQAEIPTVVRRWVHRLAVVVVGYQLPDDVVSVSVRIPPETEVTNVSPEPTSATAGWLGLEFPLNQDTELMVSFRVR